MVLQMMLVTKPLAHKSHCKISFSCVLNFPRYNRRRFRFSLCISLGFCSNVLYKLRFNESLNSSIRITKTYLYSWLNIECLQPKTKSAILDQQASVKVKSLICHADMDVNLKLPKNKMEKIKVSLFIKASIIGNLQHNSNFASINIDLCILLEYLLNNYNQLNSIFSNLLNLYPSFKKKKSLKTLG